VLVQAGSAKVRNVGENQLRLSAGSAEGSGLRYNFGPSTRRFALRGNSIQIYHKTESEQIEMPESRWLRTRLAAGLNIGPLVFLFDQPSPWVRLRRRTNRQAS
jgi:hypothetical protein